MTTQPTTYGEAMDHADRAHSAVVRALFLGGYPQAHVHQSGGMCMLVEIPLSEDPTADYPHLKVTDPDGGLPETVGVGTGWLVGLYRSDDDDGTYFESTDPSAVSLIALANAASGSV